MSHPDWDHGARPPREMRDPDARFIRNYHPQDPESPQYGAVAHTGSLEPSPEALDWARRADEWAQPEPGGRSAPEREVPGVRPNGWQPAPAERGRYPDAAQYPGAPRSPSASQYPGAPSPRSVSQYPEAPRHPEAPRPTDADRPADTPRFPDTGRPPATPTTYGRPTGPVQSERLPPWQAAAPIHDADRPAWPQSSTSADPSATIPNMPAPDPPRRSGPPHALHPADAEPRRRPDGLEREPSGRREPTPAPWQEPTQRRPWPAPGVPGSPPNDPSAHRGDGWREPADDRDRRPGSPVIDRRGIPDGSRAEPDSGGWSPGSGEWSADEDRQNGWRAAPEPPPGAPRQDAGAEPWRRDSQPAADPWAHSAADSGVIPMSWEEPAADTGSWRSPEGWPAPRPTWDNGRTARVSDSWRQRHQPRPGQAPPWDGPQPAPEQAGHWDHLRPAESQHGPDDAVTEIRQRIDSDRRHQAGMPPGGPAPNPDHLHNGRGSAAYLAGGDWRHDLAMRSDLAEGESRRFGTEDFPPGRPAPGGGYGRAKPPGPAGRARATPGTANGHPVARTPSTGLASSPSGVDEDETEDNGGVLPAVGYTIIWYGVPVILFVVYVLVFGSSDRAHALTTLSGAAPQFGLSLVVSVVVAVVLRWLVSSWRAASVGLAAAVLGGGLATVLVSAITGHSLT